MKVFNAGMIGERGDRALSFFDGSTNHRLLSYAYRELDKIPFNYIVYKVPNACVFLDSGAFTAFQMGTPIHLQEYITYLLEHGKRFFCYATLDVIGDPVQTKKNDMIMRAAGLNPVAVFHYGSSYDILDQYMEMGVDYLAMGGLVPISGRKSKLQGHLDACWSRIMRHWPVRVHAFGITAQWVLERYPFFSCDSTSAIIGGGLGRIMVFQKGVLKFLTKENGRQNGLCMAGIERGSGSCHLARRVFNVATMRRYEEYLTNLWKSRGIVW